MSTPPIHRADLESARLDPPKRPEVPVWRTGPQEGAEPRELTFGAILGVLVKHRVLIAATAAVAVLYTLVDLVRRPKTYSTTVSFVTQGQSGSASGIATLLGLGAGASNMMQTPIFYAELVSTRAILGEIADSTRVPMPSGRAVSLAEAFGVTTTDPINRREQVMGSLKKMISPAVNTRTQVLTLSVWAQDPDVALHLAQATVNALTRFNREVRKSAAAEERRFIEARRAEAKAELTATEERLRDFLRRNKGGLQSPELAFEHQRLLTEVTLRQELYKTLSQGYERARMDEVRDTPVITLIDVPQRALAPDRRPFVRGIVLALLGGVLAGVVLAFLVEALKVANRQMLARRAAPGAIT